ncbi:MAG: hypothetical protein MR021_01470 [Clostridiales bacterium]|nr:hypothetical protein [Clostridiales bacterium]
MREEHDGRRRRGHSFLSGLGRILSGGLAIALAIVLLPYVNRVLSRILPDASGRAATVSMVLKRQMEDTAFLATEQIDDEGVIYSSVNAKWIGEVQQVTIHYRYQAVLGADLTRARFTVDGDTVRVNLPALEVRSASLTPTEVEKNDFWYPLTESRRQELLDEELTKCTAYYQTENEETRDAYARSRETLRKALSVWVQTVEPGAQVEVVLGAAE